MGTGAFQVMGNRIGCMGKGAQGCCVGGRKEASVSPSGVQRCPPPLLPCHVLTVVDGDS